MIDIIITGLAFMIYTFQLIFYSNTVLLNVTFYQYLVLNQLYFLNQHFVHRLGFIYVFYFIVFI